MSKKSPSFAEAVALLLDDKLEPAWKEFQALLALPITEEQRNQILQHPAYIECKHRIDEYKALLSELNDDAGWTLIREDKDGKTLYKAEEGLASHRFKVSGVIKAPLLNVLAVIYELDLWTKWFPFMSKCVEIAKPSRFHKAAHMTLGLPFPMSNRDFVVSGFGVDLIDSKQVIVVARSVPEPGEALPARRSSASASAAAGGAPTPTPAVTAAASSSASASSAPAARAADAAQAATSEEPAQDQVNNADNGADSASASASGSEDKQSSDTAELSQPAEQAAEPIVIDFVDFTPPPHAPYVPPPKGMVRGTIYSAGFLLTATSLQSCNICWTFNVDPKMSLPSSLLNWASGKIVHWIVSYLEKAALFDKKSEYAKRMESNRAVYEYLNEVITTAFAIPATEGAKA